MRSSRGSQAEVPGRPAFDVTPGDRAVTEALGGLAATGEAQQILLVGRTGAGKTVASRALAKGYLHAAPGIVVVVDSKAERRYDDLLPAHLVNVRESVAHLVSEPMTPGCRVMIFRRGAGLKVAELEIAEWCWSYVNRGKKCCVVRDELVPNAANHGQWRRGFELVQQQYIQGRSWGLSVVSGTTALAMVPFECRDLASEVWTFRTSGPALDLLDDGRYLMGVPPGLVPNLKGKESPPDERGEFVRLVSDVAWDRRVYRFAG